tara:strand:- start:11321 stop:12946 length:1626 start_codon:yes stop_codon:yes gene_type:complete
VYKLSIVTTYYNRKDLFLRTLESIKVSKYAKDIEVVVVDDASDPNHRLEDIVDNYDFPINLIRVNPEEKWYVNPCVPFNRAIKAAQSPLVLLQNPECFHVGDVIESAILTTNESNYIVFACYALSQEQTKTFHNSPTLKVTNKVSSCGGMEGWYNHSKYNIRPYHFASCISKNNIDKVGGFDEEFAYGISWDDDDLLVRIKAVVDDVSIIDSPLVLHQWHYGPTSFNHQNEKDPTLEWRNRNLYHRKMHPEILHIPKKVNTQPFTKIPKVAHFYWEGDKFSYLHFLSVKSFIDKNPDWECIVHTNKDKVDTNNNAWSTGEQKAEYTGKNHFNKIKELDLSINEIDFKQLGIDPSLNPVHKSDLLRWHLLGTSGGAWVDFDILHTKPLSTLYSYMDKDCEGCYCYSTMPMGHYIIGFFLSKPNNPFFLKLFEEGKKESKIDYQMYGNRLMAKLYFANSAAQMFPGLNMENMYHESFYPHAWYEIDDLFKRSNTRYKDDHVVGVHWYNGDARATEFCNKFDENYNVEDPKTTIEEIINDSHTQ